MVLRLELKDWFWEWEETDTSGKKIYWHLVSIYVYCCILPHHSHPAQSGDTLTDGWKVVEEATATIPFSEALDLLDVIRNRLQQIVELRLWVKRKDRRRCECKRTADGATFYMNDWSGWMFQTSTEGWQSSVLSTGTARAQLQLFFPPPRCSIPTNIPRFTGRSLGPCKGIWLLQCLHFTYPNPVCM